MRIQARQRLPNGKSNELLRSNGRFPGSERRTLGAILVGLGKLTSSDADRVSQHQKRQGLQFGEAAIDLGIIDESELRFALSRQFEFPVLERGSGHIDELVVAAFDPHHRIARTARHLRSQISSRWLERSSRSDHVIGILSPNRFDGRSVLAANLAVAFAQLGEATLLIDADLRNPRQRQLFCRPDGPGLSAALSGRVGLETVESFPFIAGLSILKAGAVPPNPEELLGRENFGKLVSEASGRYDVVIVDSSASELGSDAELVASKARHALVIARKNETKFAAMTGLVGRLQEAGVTVVGAVMNDY
jgi:protein-tyrosine kinase